MSAAKHISTTADLRQVLEQLNLSPTVPPHLYIDLEGVNLSRHGSISILTLYDRSAPYVYLVDVYALGFAAFTTSAVNFATIVTLKSILESPKIPKVFFDVRNDSDALFANFGIELQGVQDLQVMELATRGGGRTRERVSGLAKCIQYGLMDVLTPLQRSQILTIKGRGAKMFAPDKGGSFEVFNQRPLNTILEHYCMQDVVHMPALWNVYNCKLKIRFWNFVVDHETKKRLKESQSPLYVPQGSHKSLGWSWNCLRQLEREWSA